MRVLLTGGAGMVGNAFTKLWLNKGAQVLSVDDFSLGTERHLSEFQGKSGFEFERWDVSQPDWFSPLKGRSFDLCVHFAANSDISLGGANPLMEHRKTLATTLMSLEATRILKIPHFIFSSSSAVYGDGVPMPTPENTGGMHPISNYGAAKFSSENWISSFVENYGLSAWVFRFGNVVGEKMTHGVIYDFIRKLNKNPDVLDVLGNGTQKKTYVHVEDCVGGITWAYEKSPSTLKNHASRYQVLNLSTEGHTAVKTIAENVVKQVSGGRASIQYGESNRGWVGDVPITQLDVRKIHALGWKAQLSSDEAVTNAIREHYEWTKHAPK